jgi:hypothetical protein
VQRQPQAHRAGLALLLLLAGYIDTSFCSCCWMAAQPMAAALLLLVVAASSPATALAASQQPLTVRWAGVLTMPRGIADAVPMNLTVRLPSPTAATGSATASWVYDHDNSGHPCVHHAEAGLAWSHTRATGHATATADGEGESFYSLRGLIDPTGKRFTGNLTHAGTRGTFHLTLGAPQIASTCHAKPAPPPPPLPPPPLPDVTTPATVWPLPQRESRGADAVQIDPHHFQLVAAPGSSTATLVDAFARYRAIFFPHPTAPAAPAAATAAAQGLLASVTVHVANPSAPLTLGVNESYSLTIGTAGDATIRAATVFGA